MLDQALRACVTPEIEIDSDQGIRTFYADNGSYFSAVDVDTRDFTRKFTMQNVPALDTVYSASVWPMATRGVNRVYIRPGGIQSGTGNFRFAIEWTDLQDYA